MLAVDDVFCADAQGVAGGDDARFGGVGGDVVDECLCAEGDVVAVDAATIS